MDNQRDFGLAATRADLMKIREKPDLAARRRLDGDEKTRLRERVVTAVIADPLTFLDNWFSLFEEEIHPALQVLTRTILPGLASLQLIPSPHSDAVKRDIARVCLARLYNALRSNALRAPLLADPPGDLRDTWNAIQPYGLAFDELAQLPLPETWVPQGTATAYPSHLVGEELLSDYDTKRDEERTSAVRAQLIARGVPPDVAARLGWPLLALARRAEQEAGAKVYEAICMLASLSSQSRTGGVVKARVLAMLKQDVARPGTRAPAFYPSVEIVPWSRCELTSETSRPDAGDGYRNLTDVIMPALTAVIQSRYSIDLRPYHFRIALEPAGCCAPKVHGFVGESLGLPLALAAFAATQGWAELPPIAATGLVTGEGQVTGTGLLGVREKVEYLLEYNKFLERQVHAPAVKHLYVPEGEAFEEAHSAASESLKINHKVFVDEPLRLRTLGDLLDPDVLWDPFSQYLDRLLSLFPYEDARADPALWGVTGEDARWQQDVDRYEQIAQSAMPGQVQFFPLRYARSIEPVLAFFARHYAVERIRARQAHRRAPLPALVDARQLDADHLLTAIGDVLRDPKDSDPNIRPQDLQNIWIQPDGLALILHASEDYAHSSPDVLVGQSPLIRLLKDHAQELERHRVILVARNLHQMMDWSRQMVREGILRTEPEAPDWWHKQMK